MGFLTTFIGGLYGKIIIGLVCLSLVGGALWYVDHLRSDLKIEEANNAKLISDVTAYKDQIKEYEFDLQAQQKLNNDLQHQFADLQAQEQKFEDNMKISVQAKVAKLKAAPTDGVLQKTVAKSLTAETHANLRCTEIEINGATPEDLKDPNLKLMCPELLGSNA